MKFTVFVNPKGAHLTIEKVASSPERYIGLFRPTKPIWKDGIIHVLFSDESTLRLILEFSQDNKH